jgi:DNA-binding ferritin-like protein (Dps family)
MDQMMLEIGDKFKSIPDGAAKSALAIQLFGRAGTQMIPVVENLREARDCAERLGTTLDDVQLKAMSDFKKGTNLLEAALKGTSNQIVSTLMPALNGLVGMLTSVVGGVNNWIKAHQGLTSTLATGVGAIGTFAAAGGGLIVTLGVIIRNLGTVSGALGMSQGLFLAQAGIIGACTAVVENYIAKLFELATAEDYAADATRRSNEKENELVDKLSKASVAAGLHYGQMSKLIEVYGGNVTALTMAIEKGKVMGLTDQECARLKKALADVSAEHKAKIDAEREALDKILTPLNTHKDKIKEITDDTKEWDKALVELNKDLEHEISTLPNVTDNVNTLDMAMKLFKESAKEDSKATTSLGDDVAATTAAIGKDWETYVNGPVAKATRAHESMRDSWSSIWRDMVKEAGKAIGEIGAAVIESTGIFDFLKTPAKTFDDTPYTKEQAAIKKTYGDKKTALDKTTQDTINSLDTQQSAEESAIQNSDRSEADKTAMLQALDLKYQTAREAAQAKAAADQAALDAQEVIDNQAALDKESAAKDKAAADEEKRQNSLWTKIKTIVGTAADDMLKTLMSRLFSKWADALLDIGPKTAKAVADTGQGIAGVSQAASGAISGMWTALGSAVGSFLGTLLGNLLSGGPSGHQQQQQINDTKDSRNFLADIRNWFFSAGEGFGGAAYSFITDHLLEKLDGIKGSVDTIANNTDCLKNIHFGASGVSETVSSPTLYMAGEAGTEHVSIGASNMNIQAAPITINMDGRQLAMSLARFVLEGSKAGWFKVHSNGFVSY